MDIECFGCINWVKFSEIVFEGLIVGLTVVGAYLLGKRQSDRNWKREIIQREKEQKEREENDLYEMQIRELNELHRNLISFFNQSSESSKSFYFNSDAKVFAENALVSAKKILPQFPYVQDPESNNNLGKLINSLEVLIPTIDLYSPGHVLRRITIDYDGEDEKKMKREHRYFNATRHYYAVEKAHQFIQDKIEELVQEFGKK